MSITDYDRAFAAAPFSRRLHHWREDARTQAEEAGGFVEQLRDAAIKLIAVWEEVRGDLPKRPDPLWQGGCDMADAIEHVRYIAAIDVGQYREEVEERVYDSLRS